MSCLSTQSDVAARVPELLAPAGDWEAMRAAVANGADAVYFGLSAFNARHRAANFSVEELPQVVEFLHGHNVRGYVTLNTLIFSGELEEAGRFVKAVAEAGVDAVIVQDLGLAELIGRLCPTLPIHGSTQMTLTEPLGIEFVRRLGVQRAILARELSTDDIRRIAAETPVPLEVFVHGALCVSYSGQCLTSESLGGRSANRGQCAQACRLPYDLFVDGQRRDLGDRAYLLSPQDLAAFDLVDELAGLGVACIKIEGRLKSAQYVAAATQTYRAAVDAAKAGAEFHPTPRQKSDLAQSFSRGFTHGFFDGVDHQTLVHARFPKSRGIRAGRVIEASQTGLLIEQADGVRLKPGDGVVLDEGHPEQDEQGGRIVEVRPGGRQLVEIVFHRGDVNLRAVAAGGTIWKTDDPEIRRRLEHSFSRDRVSRPEPISAVVSAEIGRPLRIRVTDQQGRCAAVVWERPLERAEKYAMTGEIFRQQFGRLGGTPFELGEVSGEFNGVMIPKSVLNDLRRQAVAELLRQRDSRSRHRVAEPDALNSLRTAIPAAPVAPDRPQLYVLARTMEQLQTVLAWSPSSAGVDRGMVYCEFEDVRRYPDAVAAARAAGVAVGLATVRVIKPNEQGLLRNLALAEPDAVLVRNLAGVSYFAAHYPDMPLMGDYSLNIANELTAGIFARHRIRRMTASYDLNWKQLAVMFERISPAWFEVTVHQQMPMFHMEHCVFAHTLSGGRDFRDCGRPCEKHRVDLRDRAGAAHPLVADVGCRNTVYNGTAQSAAEFIPRMLEIGLRHFRVELLRQDAVQTRALLDRYAAVLAGVDNGRATWRQLRVLSQLGVTRGTLE
jgi:U32 family peptidase